MSRLESIKEHIANMEAYGSGLADEDYNLYSDIQKSVENEKYLLHLVERYETALKRIEATNELVQAHFLANDALKE